MFSISEGLQNYLINPIIKRFIGGVFTDNQDPDNGGHECAHFMTFKFRLGISFVAIIIYYLIYRSTIKKLQKELTTEEAKIVTQPSLLELILGYFSIGLFIINCIYKMNSGQLIFIMNPCHMISLVEGYLLISPNGLTQRTVYTVLMNTLFSPWIALFFPVTAGLDAPFEVPLFWIEHFNCALISPLVLSMAHRYYNKSTISLRNHLFSHILFGAYQRVVLFPLSQLSHVNLNFTLCGASVDPFLSFFGRWYYIVSDFYIFAGGEVFHRLVKIILSLFKKIEAFIMGHTHGKGE